MIDDTEIPFLSPDDEEEQDTIFVLPDEGEEDMFFVPEPALKSREIPALVWLAEALGTSPENLALILERKRHDRKIYRVRYKLKPNGRRRQICAPVADLKKLQRRFNQKLLRSFGRHPNAYGFSGGNTEGAIKPHLGANCLLRLDFKDAFPTITADHIFDYFVRGREYISWRGGYAKGEIRRYGRLSWYAAKLAVELATYKGRLPQGAPTSPRLFDLVCIKMDQALGKLAKNVGGHYTRYADNVFFSLPQAEFSTTIQRAIFRIIHRRRRKGSPEFWWHKLQVRRIDDQAMRLLGLNVVGGKIHNTRAFKRNLRLAIHHVDWLLEQGRDYETAWRKLQGKMAYARTDTLPPGLVARFQELKRKIQERGQT